MFLIRKFYIALLLSFLITSNVALAKDSVNSDISKQVLSTILLKASFDLQNIKRNCTEDIERYCNVEDPRNCLKKNRNIVSNTCKNTINEVFGNEPTIKDEMYNGVLIPKGSKYFYGGGNILGVILSKPTEYKGIKFKKGQMRFHDKGPSVARLEFDQYIDEIKYKADGLGPVFNKDGSVSNAMLAEVSTINGITFAANSQIEFFAKNNVKSGTLKDDTTILNIAFEAGERISFSKGGGIDIYYLRYNKTVNGIKYAKEKRFGVWANGQVKYGVLENNENINGVDYKSTTFIEFDKHGTVIRSHYKPIEIPVAIGDTVELPDYAMAISGGSRHNPIVKYQGNEVLRIETISSRFSVANYPTEGIKVSHILEPKTKLKIIHISDKNNAILEDSNGIRYSQYMFGEKIAFQLNKCSRKLCHNFRQLFSENFKEGVSKKFEISVDFYLLNDNGYTYSYRERSKLRPPYPDGVLERTQKPWKTYCRKNNITTNLSKHHNMADAEVDLRDIANMLLSYEDLNLESIARLTRLN